jgi:hypothetical protein
MADRSREASLWAWLKPNPGMLLGDYHDVIRIENCVAVGTADVEGCIGGGTFWCELKVARVLKCGDAWVDITPAQVRRALRRTRAGGRHWVLIRYEGEGKRRHYLVDGAASEALLERRLTVTELDALNKIDPYASASTILTTMAGKV